MLSFVDVMSTRIVFWGWVKSIFEPALSSYLNLRLTEPIGVILCNNIAHPKKLSPLEVVDIIERLVRRGKISPERINESYARILRHKRQG